VITGQIIKPRLGNTYNFEIINTDVIVKVGTLSTQTHNILISMESEHL
jgi:hypothetical protein